MKQEINPKDTKRAIAFELWTKSPMPMVTLMKTFDVTRLCKVSRKRGMKFNMLLCWCIGKAASTMDEFYMLPQRIQRDNGTSEVDWKLYRYDHMAISFQFHHAQMDGSHAARFLEELQRTINTI